MTQRRIFVVEDDAMIALMIEGMLFDLGYAVIGPVGAVGEALELLAGAGEIDAALLDVNLAGKPVFPVSEALRARGVPLVYSTGYGDPHLPPADKRAIILRKPFRADELASVLLLALPGEPDERRGA